MSILTDRAESAAPVWVNLLKIGLWVFVGYAASLHYSWQDSLAGTFVLAQALRALQRQSADK